jgi:Lar family restriction alleviation protein
VETAFLKKMFKNKKSVEKENVFMKKELFSCPFCGERARAIYIATPNLHHRVTCCSCNAMSGVYGTEDEAIAAWNKRIPYYMGIDFASGPDMTYNPMQMIVTPQIPTTDELIEAIEEEEHRRKREGT